MMKSYRANLFQERIQSTFFCWTLFFVGSICFTASEEASNLFHLSFLAFLVPLAERVVLATAQTEMQKKSTKNEPYDVEAQLHHPNWPSPGR